MNETWKDVKGFEGEYQVSTLGRVKSFRKWKRANSPDEYILHPSKTERGYQNVTLYGKNGKRKVLVHRLVAETFVPNPEGLPHVNHMDENISNNCAENLEWCTAQYNNCYGTARFRIMVTNGIPVEQRLINNQLLAIYISTSVAQEITGVSRKEIAACMRGHLHSAGGYIWKKHDNQDIKYT